MTFGEKLKKLREEKGLSKKDIASKTGISDVTYGRYESGKVKAVQKKEVYSRLAEVFGCTEEYLMNENAEESAVESKAKAPAGKSRAKGKAAKSADAPAYVELQYGEMSVSFDDIVNRARKAAGGWSGKIDIYVKPVEGMVYYVAGDETGSFEI